MRLLESIDEAVADGSGMPGELSEFERIVLHGVAVRPGRSHRSAPEGLNVDGGLTTAAEAQSPPQLDPQLDPQLEPQPPPSCRLPESLPRPRVDEPRGGFLRRSSAPRRASR